MYWRYQNEICCENCVILYFFNNFTWSKHEPQHVEIGGEKRNSSDLFLCIKKFAWLEEYVHQKAQICYKSFISFTITLHIGIPNCREKYVSTNKC